MGSRLGMSLSMATSLSSFAMPRTSLPPFGLRLMRATCTGPRQHHELHPVSSTETQKCIAAMLDVPFVSAVGVKLRQPGLAGSSAMRHASCMRLDPTTKPFAHVRSKDALGTHGSTAVHRMGSLPSTLGRLSKLMMRVHASELQQQTIRLQHAASSPLKMPHGSDARCDACHESGMPHMTCMKACQ